MHTDKYNNKNQMPHDEMLRRLWNKDVADMPDEELHEALSVFQKRRMHLVRLQLRERRFLNVMKYAAVLLLPLVASWMAWNYSAEYYADRNEMMQCYVPEGKIDSLVLSDNTKVIINAGSSIVYPATFSSHSVNRNVYVYGNCHFAVAKNPLHPFVVNMGNLKVKVLGTHFSVNSYNDDEKIMVTLEEGLVNVFDKQKSMTLHPNEQLVYYRADGRMEKYSVDALACNSWVNGNLDFSAQPLGVIIKTLERRYGVKIRIMPGVDVNKRYTMSFNHNESVDDVMGVLTVVSGGIKCKRAGKTITLY